MMWKKYRISRVLDLCSTIWMCFSPITFEGVLIYSAVAKLLFTGHISKERRLEDVLYTL